MTERDAETAADIIRDSIFRVTNMIGVGLLNSKGKSVAITDPAYRPDDITYFNFRAKINPHLVDTRAPNSVHLFEFTLRLSNTIPFSSASLPIKNSVQINNTPAPVYTFDSILSKMPGNDLQFRSAARMWALISARHNTLTASSYSGVSRTLQFTTPSPSTTVVASIRTPKIDMVCSPSPVVCIYTGPLDFLDDQ